MTLPRDFVGYAGRPPTIAWPNGGRLALVLVLNIEEGAEPSIPDGDPATELALTDAIPARCPPARATWWRRACSNTAPAPASGASGGSGGARPRPDAFLLRPRAGAQHAARRGDPRRAAA
jgi:hypothetical protein